MSLTRAEQTQTVQCGGSLAWDKGTQYTHARSLKLSSSSYTLPTLLLPGKQNHFQSRFCLLQEHIYVTGQPPALTDANISEANTLPEDISKPAHSLSQLPGLQEKQRPMHRIESTETLPNESGWQARNSLASEHAQGSRAHTWQGTATTFKRMNGQPETQRAPAGEDHHHHSIADYLFDFGSFASAFSSTIGGFVSHHGLYPAENHVNEPEPKAESKALQETGVQTDTFDSEPPELHSPQAADLAQADQVPAMQAAARHISSEASMQKHRLAQCEACVWGGQQASMPGGSDTGDQGARSTQHMSLDTVSNDSGSSRSQGNESVRKDGSSRKLLAAAEATCGRTEHHTGRPKLEQVFNEAEAAAVAAGCKRVAVLICGNQMMLKNALAQVAQHRSSGVQFAAHYEAFGF